MTRTSAGLRRRRATAGVLALTTVTGIALAPPSAGAPAPAGFVVPGYDVRVALANGRVFEAATDLADDSVHVFDLAGQQLAAIPGEPDVRALTASADGTRIYVALGTSQAVSVIDTASLTEIARYDVSAIGTPVQFAEAGDRLFVAGSRGPWDLGVGVVAISQPGSSATAIAGGSPPWARIAAYESSPGVSQLYVTGCSITGSCPLEHYTYTGGADAALQQRDYLSLPRGMALTADGSALLTSAGDDTVSVRNPDDLSITATIAGAYDGAWTSLVNERLVQVAYNKVGNSYDQVQVRDLTGALTYSYQAGRALIPLTGAGSSDVYAAVLGSDMTWRIERLANALGTPAAPTTPQGLTATVKPGGTVALSWAPVSLRELDAPTSYRLYRSSVAGVLGTGIARLPSRVTTFTDTALSTGTRYYYTVVAGGIAGDSPASGQVAAVADASAPKTVMTRPAALVQLAPAVAVSYSATDTGSGVASYDVRYRAAAWYAAFGGYRYPAGWQHTTATSQTLTGTPGRQYCVSARSRDRAGNVSAWSTERCTTLPVDDRSLAAVSGGWTRPASSGSYLGTVTRTSTLGAQLRLTVPETNRIALVVTQCPTCGNVAIYLNNVYWRTVPTYAATTRRGVILAQPAFSRRSTTITLRSMSAGKNLLVDGLGITRS